MKLPYIGSTENIGAASAYQKPLVNPVITESSPLKNPYWQYSCDKIACEQSSPRGLS